MKKTKSGKWTELHYIGRDPTRKKQYKRFTAETRREVSLLIAEWETSEKARKAAHPSQTIREALDDYIRIKRAVLSPSTIRGYDQMLYYFGEDCEIAGIDVEKVTTKQLQAFIGVLALDHSPKTVRNIWGFLSAALALSAPDRVFRVTLPSKVPVKRTVPTDGQVKQLLDAAGPELKKAIILGSLGLRRGEVCALKQSDIYPDLCLISVHSDMVQDDGRQWIHKDIPKTSASVRTVRVPRELLKELTGGDPDDYVVGIVPSKVTRRFTDLRDRLGIDVSFHSLRRYYASVQHALGVPDKYIQASGGWSSPEVMRRCYEHVMEDKDAEISKKVTDYYAERFGKTKSVPRRRSSGS